MLKINIRPSLSMVNLDPEKLMFELQHRAAIR